MKRRLITAAMAASVLFSFAACDLFNGLTNKQTEITTEAETTTSEATTTTEETTTEETTEATSEETTTEETTSEETTTATPTPTKAPTKKPTKIPTKPTYIPNGWKKEKAAWNKKFKGKKVYIIRKGDSYKGWYNGKWVKLYLFIDELVEDGTLVEYRYYRGKNYNKLYYSYEG